MTKQTIKLKNIYLCKNPSKKVHLKHCCFCRFLKQGFQKLPDSQLLWNRFFLSLSASRYCLFSFFESNMFQPTRLWGQCSEALSKTGLLYVRTGTMWSFTKIYSMKLIADELECCGATCLRPPPTVPPSPPPSLAACLLSRVTTLP